MLSIAKLRVGQEAYHLSGVAESLDAYYTGSGEAAGQWVGGSAARLGLTGEVTAEDLQAVLAGIAPGTGGLSPNGTAPAAHKRRVPGFDLTFKAPKSASVLYAVSDDPRVQGAIIDAGEHAMRAAIGWLEREAIRVQRGSHNVAWLARHTDEPASQPHQLGSAGVVAASFRHRTSRAGDPLLHWHVLVANLVEGADGKWSAFGHPNMYRHARAAGEVFQAIFRDELSTSLGVSWRPGKHVPEIAGIPQAVLEAFSKRTGEIEAWLAATGTPDTPDGRQQAALATRRNKAELEGRRFDDGWKDEADLAGWGPFDADALIAATGPHASREFGEVWRLPTVGFDEDGRVDHYDRVVDPEEYIATVLRQDLTAERTTFTTPDLYRAIAARQGQGVTIDTLERLTARFVASDQVVAVASNDSQQRWTSREILDTEQRLIQHLLLDDSHNPVPPESIDAVGPQRDLGHDQHDALQTICSSTAPVMVLVGPAGTGKTYTVDAIRAAFEHAGHTVIGAAPSARAAIELEAGANIRSSTLHSLLHRWTTEHDTPTLGPLLVIDEAGMTDLRTLDSAITQQLASGGRVLLVGDHHQLPEVGAGGGFAYAATHSPCVSTLTVNRRQREEWEQAALTELRNGSVGAAVTAYLDHDRVIVSDTPADTITAAVDRWFEARNNGQRAVLLAGTNQQVDALNQAVIERLIANGELDPTTSQYNGRDHYIGDRIVIRRNATERTAAGEAHAIANGQAGTITHLRTGALTIRLDSGPVITLDDNYLRRGGHITHAYALTTHRAQGGTWDQAIAVGLEGLYRQNAYVQLSRGEIENWLIITNPELAELRRLTDPELDSHNRGLTPSYDQPGPTDEELTNKLSIDRSKHLVHHHDSDAGIVDQLAHTLSHQQLKQQLHTAHIAEYTATNTVGASGQQLTDRLTRLTHNAAHLAVGQHVSPHDRYNVGTITEIDDPNGSATVHFVSESGREADREFAWHDLRIIDVDPPPHVLGDKALRTLHREHHEIADMLDRWNQIANDLGAEPGDVTRYQRALHRRTERLTADLAVSQPDWLQSVLGPRPHDAVGAQTWDDATRTIVNHQATANGSDVDDAELARSLCETRIWLASNDRQHPIDLVSRTVDELEQRLDQLDQILASAPADCRHLIAELQSGQLTLVDTAEHLRDLLNDQQARRDWIVEHWPHIIEYHEVTRALVVGDEGELELQLSGSSPSRALETD
jgi:conjugative relaxase-like TrwC/TraI family protein